MLSVINCLAHCAHFIPFRVHQNEEKKLHDEEVDNSPENDEKNIIPEMPNAGMLLTPILSFSRLNIDCYIKAVKLFLS